MKRFLLVLMLSLIVLTGCTPVEAPEETAQQTTPEASVEIELQTTPEGVVLVSNVDELLAAIGPDREILMAPGTYDLCEAFGYACAAESGYYEWADCGDGYQLVLKEIQNLTVRGSGMEETVLLTSPRYANVIALRNCANVVLEDFTAGHTDGGECAGGAVSLLGSMDVVLNRLGLYGCGTIGVQTDLCTGITVSGCDIYECSAFGIWANHTDGLTVESSSLHDLGDRYNSGVNVFWFNGCTDVLVSDCEVTDNEVLSLSGGDPSIELVLRNNTFARNRFEGPVFDIYTSGMVLDNCTFKNNNIRSWFSGAGITILDGIGKTLTEEMLDREYNGAARKQPVGEQKTVTAANVDELLAAIGPDTEIILKNGVYDLSTAQGYGTSCSDYYYWIEEFDGPVLTVAGVNNLTIRSESGDMAKCTISAVPRYANVFNFRKCSNLSLSGFTAGHTVEPGECMGGVLDFEGCDTVLVENCGLFGCGILGVQARLSGDIAVKECDIYECSYGGIAMSDVVGVVIEGCTFRDLGGEAVSFYECKNVTVDGEAVDADAGRWQHETTGDALADAMKREVSEASERNSKLLEKLQNDGTMTQADINDNARQRYELWDGVLNKLWDALEQSVDADAFEALKAEQLAWIAMKEAQAEYAAAPVAGGSLYPTVYYGEAAKLTEERVVTLLGYLTGEQELPPAEIADAPDELIAGQSTIEDVSLYYQAEYPLKDVYSVFRDFDGNGWGDLAVWHNGCYLGIYFMEDYIVSNILLFDEIANLYEYWRPGEAGAEVVPNIIGTYELEYYDTVEIYTFYDICEDGLLCMRDCIKYDANGGENKWFTIGDADWAPITEEEYNQILESYHYSAENLKSIEEYYLR